MKIISYAKLQEHYAGEYIARKGRRIFEHAETYPQLKRKLKSREIDQKTLTIGFVPPKRTLCIYGC